MELKNVNDVDSFFWKIVKIELKNNHYMFFFLQDAVIARKTKFFILPTSLINIEWIKAFLVDMDLFYKRKKFNNFLGVFFVFI
jgi:hypothetical protein